MGICGYNDFIGKGLESFVDGMIEALQDRASRLEQPIHEAVQGEISELHLIVEQLRGVDPLSLLTLFRELDSFAAVFFSIVEKRMRAGEQFADACRAVGQDLKQLLSAVDHKHRTLPANRESTLELVRWVKAADSTP